MALGRGRTPNRKAAYLCYSCARMKYTNYLKWGVLAGIFLVPLVPFIVANGVMLPNFFFPFITGKNFIFRILVEFSFLCYVLLALREPRFRPRGSVLLWTALAFVGWMALATIFSVDPIKSFWSNFERMEGYVALIHLFVWFVITGAVLSAENLWERFFNVSITASAVQGLYAVFQIMGALAISTQSGSRADTTFGNAAYLGVYFLIHFFLTLYMLSRTKRNVTLQVLYGSALVLQVVGLFFTETRGAIIGLIGGVIVAALWVAIRGSGKDMQVLRRWSIGMLAFIVLLVGVFIAIRDTSFVRSNSTLNRLADISLQDRTTTSRFQIWNMAFQGAMEKPVIGWGQENFSYVFNKYYDPGMYEQEQWFDRAHNQFLDWLIAGGFPAFALHIALYALGLWAIFRGRLTVAEQAALFGLLAAYAFNNSLVFDNLVSAIYFWALLAYFHSLIRRDAPTLRWSRPLSDHTVAIAAPVLLAVVLVGGWALNAPGISRAEMLVNALQTQVGVTNAQGITVGAPRPIADNIAAFAEAVHPTLWPGTQLGFQESVEQYFQFATNNVAPSTSIDPQVKSQVFDAVSAAGKELMAQRPGDARLELFLATFLAQFGQTSEAIKHYELALQDSPNKQQILIQLGGTYIQTGNSELGLAALKKAFELEPKYDSARIFYVAGLNFAGKTAEADKLLMERFNTTVVDNDQLLQIYMSTKQYARAADIWKLRIEKNPTDPQLQLGLASVYFASCNLTATIAELKKIGAANPGSAPQMQQLITQIQDGTLKCPTQ